MMKKGYRVVMILMTCALISGAQSLAGDHPRRHPPHTAIVLELTEEFYRALQQEADHGARTLSTNMSEGYLHQIAVASRYTVETNLQVLRQQERIIELLQEIKALTKQGGR